MKNRYDPKSNRNIQSPNCFQFPIQSISFAKTRKSHFNNKSFIVIRKQRKKCSTNYSNPKIWNLTTIYRKKIEQNLKEFKVWQSIHFQIIWKFIIDIKWRDELRLEIFHLIRNGLCKMLTGLILLRFSDHKERSNQDSNKCCMNLLLSEFLVKIVKMEGRWSHGARVH